MGKAMIVSNVNWASKNYGRVTLPNQLVIDGAVNITSASAYTAKLGGNPVVATWSLNGSGSLSTLSGTTTTLTPSANGLLTLTAEYGGKMASININAIADSVEVIDYVESSGAQFLTTDYYTNANTVIETRYDFTNITQKQQRIFSNRVTDIAATQLCELYLNGSGSNASAIGSITGVTYISGNITWGYKFHADCLSKSATMTRMDTQADTVKTIAQPTTSTTTLRLFGSYKADENYQMASIKMYYFKIWENNVLLHDFEPRKVNGVVGMMDIVTNIFYPSETETAFIYSV